MYRFLGPSWVLITYNICPPANNKANNNIRNNNTTNTNTNTNTKWVDGLDTGG